MKNSRDLLNNINLKNMKKLVIISFIILSASPMKAQKDLSLEDAIRIGLERNYDIRIEQKNIEESINNNSWGEAGRYPNITLNFNQNNSIQDNVETATPFQIQDVTQSRILNPVVSLDWTLFNGFKVNMSKKRLENLEQQTEGNASIVVSNTIQSIILGYYTAVLEKERLRELQKQLDLSRDKYEYFKLKKELGGAVTADLLLEENNYLTDSTNLINQQLSYRNAIRNLNVLLAEEPDTQYNLTDPLEIEVVDYQFGDLYDQLENNVDLKKQYISQQILKYDTRIRKAERYPTLSLRSSYSNNRNRLDLSEASFPAQNQDGTLSFIPGPQDPLNSVTNTTSLNFVISFNLFNGGKINRAIQNAIIQEDIGNIQTDRLKNSLHKDLLEAYDEYNIRKLLNRINSRKRETSEQNLEISEEKFRNGTINSFDYRTVQNNNLVAAIQELQSIYNLIDSKVTLMRLTGGLIGEYRK